MLQRVSILHSFLWLNDIPVCGQTMFIPLSADGRLGCFSLLPILNSPAINIWDQVFAGTCVFISLGHTSRSGIALAFLF